MLVLEFVSSIINHRVNLGKLLKIFQVAKNHNEAFTGSNVYSVIHRQQRLERWHGCERPPLGREAALPPRSVALGPGARGIFVVLRRWKGLLALGPGAGRSA